LAARQVGLAILATVRAQLGSLDRVRRVIRLLGMVNATADFREHPAVINGCSELFADIFGPDNELERAAQLAWDRCRAISPSRSRQFSKLSDANPTNFLAHGTNVDEVASPLCSFIPSESRAISSKCYASRRRGAAPAAHQNPQAAPK